MSDLPDPAFGPNKRYQGIFQYGGKVSSLSAALMADASRRNRPGPLRLRTTGMTRAAFGSEYNWQGAGTKLPCGHRIFAAHNNVPEALLISWGIADDSGHYPHETDDGVLWLDKRRTLRIMTEAGEPEVNVQSHEICGIPVVDNEGKQYSVGTTPSGLLLLSRMFSWTIEDEERGHFYNVGR